MIKMLKPHVQTLDTRTAKPIEKHTDSHYGSSEHKAWALDVKRRAGWRCEHVTNGVRCERSRVRGDQMYADHIQNIRDYPELATDPKNGRCFCNSHNTRAGLQDRLDRQSR